MSEQKLRQLINWLQTIITHGDGDTSERLHTCELAIQEALATMPPASVQKPVAWQWRSKNKEGEWTLWAACSEDTAISRESENRTDIQVRALCLAPSGDRSVKALDEIGDREWQELLDKDDRTSPAEYPDMALITRDELKGFIARALSTKGASDHG